LKIQLFWNFLAEYPVIHPIQNPNKNYLPDTGIFVLEKPRIEQKIVVFFINKKEPLTLYFAFNMIYIYIFVNTINSDIKFKYKNVTTKRLFSFLLHNIAKNQLYNINNKFFF
jgi:hypothetical protein